MLPVFVMFDFSSSSTGNRAQRMASDLYAVCNKFGDLGPPCNFSNFQAQLNERRAWSHVGKELVRFLVSAGFRCFLEYRQLLLNFSIFLVKKGLDPRVPSGVRPCCKKQASHSLCFKGFSLGLFLWVARQDLTIPFGQVIYDSLPENPPQQSIGFTPFILSCFIQLRSVEYLWVRLQNRHF